MASESLFDLRVDGWEYTSLGEICAKGHGGVQTGPFGSQLHASDYVPTGIPSIMPQNIGDNRIVRDGIARITNEDAARLSRYRVRVGDIIYSRRGDVERRALVRQEEDGWLCGTGCLRVRFGAEDVDASYASFYLGEPKVRAWIVRHAHGATMPNLNTEILSALPFVVPPLEEQRAIAHILGTLDDKIELNRRRNETLEAMARALFQSWFVDFDPVRAKAAVRREHPRWTDAEVCRAALPTLAPEIAALFPDSFENSELGEIPVGWTVEAIDNLAEAVGGSTPSTKEESYWSPEVHSWATPKDLSALKSPVLLKTERQISDSGLGQIGSGLLPVGTVLMSSRAPIGYLAIAETPVAINQGFIAMKPKENVSNLFLLYWAECAQEAIKSRANGSTFLEISKSNFRQIEIVRPTGPLMEKFDSIVRSWYRQVASNERQSSTLAGIRDALLPKLISGEIRLDQKEERV